MKPREALQPHSRHKGRKQVEQHAGHEIHNSTLMPHQGFLAAANKGPRSLAGFSHLCHLHPLNGILSVSTFLTTLLWWEKPSWRCPGVPGPAWMLHDQVCHWKICMNKLLKADSQSKQEPEESFKINKMEQPTPEETGISWIQEAIKLLIIVLKFGRHRELAKDSNCHKIFL